MITQMRTLVKSRAAQSLLLMGLVALVAMGLLELGKSAPNNDWVARVNGRSITSLNVERQVVQQEMVIQQLVQQLHAEYGPEMGQRMAQMYINAMGLNNKDQKGIARRELIQNALLDDAAATLSLPVSDETITNQLAAVDPAALKHYLRQLRLNFPEFQEEQKNAIARSVLHQLVLHGECTADFILKNYYQTNQLSKQFSFVEYSLDTFIKQYAQKEISDEELRAFYQARNKAAKAYIVPEKRIGAVWKFDPSSYKLTITPQDVETYYKSHQSEFQDKPMQLVARRILFAVEKAEDTTSAYEQAKELQAYLVEHPTEFAQKAEKLSQDAQTAKQGGLLAPFAKGTHDVEFEKAAFLLETNGAISNIVRTKHGFEIIQREDKKGQTFKTLQEVEPLIKAQLQQMRFNNIFANAAKDVVAKAASDAQALDSFVMAHGAKKQPIVATQKDTHRIAQELFRLKEGGMLSYQDGDVGFVVLLEKIEPTYTHDLEVIKDRVRADLVKDLATEELKKAVEAANAQARGLTAAEFKNAFQSSVQTKMISAQDQESIKEMNAKGISTDALFQLEIPGSVLVTGSPEKKYLVHLDAVAAVDEADFAQKKEELRVSASQMESQSLFDGFVASLYRTATIKQN